MKCIQCPLYPYLPDSATEDSRNVVARIKECDIEVIVYGLTNVVLTQPIPLSLRTIVSAVMYAATESTKDYTPDWSRTYLATLPFNFALRAR